MYLAVGHYLPCQMQVALLRRKFEEVLGEKARQLVDVSTIDGFQVHLLASNTASPGPCPTCYRTDSVVPY